MSYRLLPLNGLRTLEACARLGSLTRAAEELGVTPSAVRYQIRQMEGLTGQPLFNRHGPRIEATDCTRSSMQAMESGFNYLQRAYNRLQHDDRNSLDISADVSFAALWLSPLLPEFEALYPDLRINLLSPLSGQALISSHADIAITAHSPVSDPSAVELQTETFLPLQAPSRHRDQLLTIEPLHAQDTYPNWERWQTHYGSLSGSVRRYSLAMLAIQAAKSGEGLVLASTLLALDDIRSGQLQCPKRMQGKPLHARRNLHLNSNRHPRAHAFTEWLSDKITTACNDAVALIG